MATIAKWIVDAALPIAGRDLLILGGSAAHFRAHAGL
jgi:hypothetical protein